MGNAGLALFSLITLPASFLKSFGMALRIISIVVSGILSLIL